MVSLLPTKFHEVLFSSFRRVALTSCFSSKFREISKFKGHNSHKIQEIKNFLVICTTKSGVLTTYQALDDSSNDALVIVDDPLMGGSTQGLYIKKTTVILYLSTLVFYFKKL
jgi:pyridoxal/pyridoxine/pyridoxamine kinase